MLSKSGDGLIIKAKWVPSTCVITHRDLEIFIYEIKSIKVKFVSIQSIALRKA